MMELIRNTTIAVGTDPVVVSEEQDGINAERSVLIITNISTGGDVVTISPADEAQANKGIPLSVGGWYADSKDIGYKPTNRRITAIASGATGLLSVHERIVMRVD